MQERLVPEVDAGVMIAEMARQVVTWFASQDATVVITEHCADKLGSTTFQRPDGAMCLNKRAFSALKEHSLQVVAPQDQVLVCGMEAHVCVLQTVLDLLEAGKQVFIVSDLVASHDAGSKMFALDRMKDAGAIVVTTEMMLFEWVGTAANESFRDMLRLVKNLRTLKAEMPC
jgi:nicotinamidase-related amidase